MVYPTLLPLMRTPRLSVVDWTEAPADLNGLVRFAERRNLVSARVPSHFKRSLPNVTSRQLPSSSLLFHYSLLSVERDTHFSEIFKPLQTCGRQKVTWFHTEYPQMLGANVQNVVTLATRRTGFVHPCCVMSVCWHCRCANWKWISK